MVYDPLKVNVVIAGVYVTGFSEGSMVECARNEDRITPYMGVKGEWAAALNMNNSGTITITLQQGSPMNDILQRLSNRLDNFPIMVIDTNIGGAFKAGGNNSIILTEPSVARNAELTDRVWTIFVFDYSNIV